VASGHSNQRGRSILPSLDWPSAPTPIGGHIDRGPIEGDFAPGYYFFVFEDTDGIRLEVNFVPGKGLLVSPDNPLLPSTDPNWDQNP
jgi:hypothetical protein